MAKLIAVSGPNVGTEYTLGASTILGRDSDSDVVVPSRTASRHHARITRSDEGFVIEDLDSRNSTFLDDDQITRALLIEGCHVVIGKVRYLFQERGTALSDSIITSVRLEEEGAAIIQRETEPTWHAVLDRAVQAGNVGELRSAVATAKRANDAGRTLRQSLDPKEVLNRTADRLMELLPAAELAVVLVSDPTTTEVRPKILRTRSGAAPTGTVPVARQFVDQAQGARRAVLGKAARSVMCAPLIAADSCLGALYVEAAERSDFSPGNLDLLAGLSGEAADALANAILHEEVTQRQRVTRDTQLARRIQKTFLPRALPQIAGYEFAAHHSAGLEVGGDFYDFVGLPDGQLGILIGDVSGKGIPAALNMARLLNEVRFHALSLASPAELLAQLNQALVRYGEEDSFVSLLVMTLDAARARLTLANAGHQPPVLRSNKMEVERLASEACLPLGVEKSARYTDQRFALSPGDIVVAFTDGITEATNTSLEHYTYSRLEKLLGSKGHSARSLVNHIIEDVDDFIGDAPEADDIAIVAFGAVA
jgi:sigma-B regulation protein RsbU (phosphoserine phosphatase)